jgi:formate dehydrogenase subunit gamma
VAQRYIVKEDDGKKVFFRFTVNQRLQHIVLAATVIILVLTGMPLKFHDVKWAPYLYSQLGGIGLAPIVHRIAGVILLLLFLYHIGYLACCFYVGEIVPLKKSGKMGWVAVIRALLRQPMIPDKKDLFDILDLFKYLLFISGERPQGAEFTWKEKFDYWAPFWGVVIIGSTGIVMWAQELTTKILPGEVISFALIAHSDEALLAALFLFIWHWYNVHFSTSVFPMGTVFLTGYLNEELMVEEHYEYYVEVMKREGFEDQILPPDTSATAAPEDKNEGHSQS